MFWLFLQQSCTKNTKFIDKIAICDSIIVKDNVKRTIYIDINGNLDTFFIYSDFKEIYLKK